MSFRAFVDILVVIEWERTGERELAFEDTLVFRLVVRSVFVPPNERAETIEQVDGGTVGERRSRSRDHVGFAPGHIPRVLVFFSFRFRLLQGRSRALVHPLQFGFRFLERFVPLHLRSIVLLNKDNKFGYLIPGSSSRLDVTDQGPERIESDDKFTGLETHRISLTTRFFSSDESNLLESLDPLRRLQWQPLCIKLAHCIG